MKEEKLFTKKKKNVFECVLVTTKNGWKVQNELKGGSDDRKRI